MTGITDTVGAVVSGYSVATALAGAGSAVQTLHMNPSGTSGPIVDARMTPSTLRQGNPHGVGINVDYMA